MRLPRRCKLLRPDRPVVRLARLKTDPQRFQRGTQLGLTEPFGGELGARLRQSFPQPQADEYAQTEDVWA